MSKLGIITALPAEARCLYSGPLEVAVPKQITENTLLCLSGMGLDSARDATLAVINQHVDALLCFGVAGGLAPDLEPGELLLIENVTTPDTQYRCDKNWLSRLHMYLLETNIPVRSGNLYSSDQMLALPEDKQNLYRKAACEAIDMESAAIAEIAFEAAIPFCVMRAIADTAADKVPDVVIEHTDNLGKPDIGPFIKSCLLEPRQIPQIMHLAKRFSKALATLKHAGRDLKTKQFLYNTQP